MAKDNIYHLMLKKHGSGPLPESLIDKRLEGVLQLLFAFTVIAAVFYLGEHVAALREYGYLGVFAISMLSSATLFFPAPGWATVVGMSSVLDPVLIGIAAGVGAGLGESTGYLAGDGILDIIEKNNQEGVVRMKSQIKKYGIPAVFFLSFIPNPVFDVAGVIAGSIHMGWWRFIIPCIAGRTLRYILLAYFGSFTLGVVS